MQPLAWGDICHRGYFPNSAVTVLQLITVYPFIYLNTNEVIWGTDGSTFKGEEATTDGEASKFCGTILFSGFCGPARVKIATDELSHKEHGTVEQSSLTENFCRADRRLKN